MRHAELGVDRRPCFFLHIRHTGGTTLERRIHHNFGAEEWYPFSGEDRAKIVQAKVRSGSWLGLSSRQLAAVDFFSLHQPLWVRDALAARLGVQPYTLTLLRDPVERTLSQVKRLATIANWSESLEDFYRIPRVRKRMCWNCQVREFLRTEADDEVIQQQQYVILMTRDRDTIDVEYPLELDAEALARARAALATIDAIGFTDTVTAFVDDLAARFGWSVKPPLQANVSPAMDVPHRLRALIEADSGPDLEFYAYARDTAGARVR